MTDGYEGIGASRIEHLRLIQGVVGRLANNSFLMKGWAVTLVTAVLGFAVSRQERNLAWIALGPVVLLGLLDAYFLYAERLFRALYEQVRQPGSSVEPFYMAATSEAFRSALRKNGVTSVEFKDALRRPVVWLFHLALLVATVLVALTLSSTH